MDVRPLLIAGLLGLSPALADPPPETVLTQSPEDPFYFPPEAQAYALRVTRLAGTENQKLQALLRAYFRPANMDGLAFTYDNARTRTVEEVWTERKANCLSLTAYFVASCRALGIPVHFAEALNTNHWRKVGPIVHFERHVVAVMPVPPMGDMVADFVPELRKAFGMYVVVIIPEARFRALYYSNLSVEALTAGDYETAKRQAQQSLEADPKCSVGWNVLGVVSGAMGDPEKAEDAYRRAMALDPKDGAPIGNLEMVLRNQGRLEEAAKFRQIGEQVRKKDPYFHAYLAEEALNEGDLAEAGSRIKAALKILPKDPEFLLFLARVKMAEGDLDAALKEIKLAKRWSDPAERARWDNKLAAIQSLKAGKVQQ
jgi:Tfp pilus assembly protein PilF